MTNRRMSSNQSLVSIITPSYNNGEFIEECIKSVLVQNYLNVEHIIQDGGSQDNTLKILKKYSDPKYKGRVKWVSHKDNGPTDAYNKALLRSTGDLILFLGADDVLMKNACSWGVKMMARYKDAAVIYGDEYVIDKRSKILKKFLPQPFNFTKLLCLELVPPTEASFIRRSAFKKVGFYLDKSLKNCVDYELFIRIGSKFPVRHTKGFVTKYRWHPNSRTRSAHLITNFIKEKKKVMNRFFESNTTPENIKKRAYEGLYFWAAQMQIDSGDNNNALKYLAKALLVNPSEEKLAKYVKYWNQTVVNQNLKVSLKEKNHTLISIVTPSYNSGQFIEECIESILAQDYPNIEHIIQDGGSTDQTKLILRKFKQPQYKNRIKIFSEPDNGQSDALDRAIKKTRGEIILVLNADDALMPYAVSWGIEQMKNYPEYGVIYGDSYIIDENSQIIDIIKSKEFNFEQLLCVELVPPAQAAFIRRAALEKVGFRADSSLDTCPDYEMWVRITQKFPMKHVFGAVTKYRHHNNPQPDSGKKRTTERFVSAKREVMDRLFNNPKTPQSIKKLKRRAHAGLDLWACQTAYDLGEPKQAFIYLLRSLLLMPSRYKFWRIFKELKGFLKYRLSLIWKYI